MIEQAEIEIRPKRINDDPRIAKLLAESLVFHSNYDPGVQGSLEEVLNVSESTYRRPSNARELYIIDAAYDLVGRSIPYLKAIYMRNFVSVEEAKRRFGWR